MTPALHPYLAYKPSGIDWFGDVPEHWELRRLKEAATVIAGQSPPSEIVSAYLDDFPFLQGNAEFGSMYPNARLACETPPKCAKAGDILLSVRAPVGALNVADRIYGIGRGLCAVRVRPDLDGLFAYFALGHANQELLRLSTGSTYDAVTVGIVGGLGLPLPPLAEQAAIVWYLIYVDRRLRRYVEAKRKLIALLEEERQAVIHQAVTRGLDPNVPLKPSGVEWLGDIPAHWEVRTLGKLAVSFRTGPFGSTLHQSDYVEGGTPVINPIHMRNGTIVEDSSCSVSDDFAERLSKYWLEQHDLVFARRGELGRCSLVRNRETGWLCGTGSIRVRIDFRSLEPEFLIRALQVRWVGEFLSLSSVGATMDNLNTGILKGVPVLVPPIQEQRCLLEFIAQKNGELDTAIARSQRQIELVEEYRTRLIADVVTGKLDVRATAAGLPDEEDDTVPPWAEGKTDHFPDAAESVPGTFEQAAT